MPPKSKKTDEEKKLAKAEANKRYRAKVDAESLARRTAADVEAREREVKTKTRIKKQASKEVGLEPEEQKKPEVTVREYVEPDPVHRRTSSLMTAGGGMMFLSLGCE